ncbi:MULTISPECIES: sodium-translocating pyrophosphatase [Clostridium]|uniref:Putative K(+)-stimulated pyrophosphate-energized sodium pump n=2 Tax=Clostridium TaxID=1485 RepID=A0A151ANU9_9CLOT|nr:MULTISPECIES: sodium-translocating pyrophosphatase [Clostridium]KYH29067.1 putative K(+)-stimulated pyrophosphate-energized sodium pump [Clostridium colicanis DSM 13634]MBE6043822.1 sodium-translocating pyrophosphatase [Clostridium thermopalmarium]PRR74395.1 putative K(+)-stimulated pyrophosphate-energized sodium pump [Clostridium thermopalmarium DSM 5974]PVZ21658.1 K(+)-stimulated pyrophosphate-energized sodium pump [Clostridium thermopalmarium DSM 5974]
MDVALSVICGLLALIFAFALSSGIAKKDPGNERMKEISGYIHEGAMAFLMREYKYLAGFIAVVAIVIAAAISYKTAICFVCGAIFSILAGYFGMNVATKANVRTAQSARKGQSEALKIAFSGGAVMGLSVVGLGVLGLGIFCLIFNDNTDFITGFGLGASSIALFARVGGGIYTKAADVGADLVGKVEAGIPEDDPRNPAVIADNVGDNVGDVAGMGADLFESYVGSIISALTLGYFLFSGEQSKIIFPLTLAAIGILASIIGVLFARNSKNTNPQKALNAGTYIGGVLVIIGSFILSKQIFGDYKAFGAILSGLIVGILIGKITEIYTADQYNSVKKIAKQSETGAATTIISGLAVGMYSTMLPIVLICIGILFSFYIMGGASNISMGLYGISLAAVGMLSTTGLVVAVDAYGPIADNAGGIAEMSELPHNVREVTDKLDSVGNTTAAIGKGFAIGSAALTALALFASYAQATNLKSIDLLTPVTLVGVLLGAMIPFLFGALTMESVGKAANKMIEEVRRQFKTIPGIMEGKGKPDYKRCVDISTAAALKEMILPGILAIAVPLLIGMLLGVEALGGLIGGAVSSGVLVAILMANAGGAWDNAKKYIESGTHGGKGSDAHKAAVVGDTVGDPFKDTSGPAMNILIKLMTIVSLVFAPVILKYGGILLNLFK